MFFWYVKVCILWKFIQNTILRQNTNVKKFLSDKIRGTKNALFFLSPVPTHHSLNLTLIDEFIWAEALSKTVCRIFHFRFRFVFVKVYIFVQLKVWNATILFKIKIIEKPQTVLLPHFWTRRFKIQWYLHELQLPKNWPGEESFKLRKSSRENVTFYQ